MHMIKVNQIIYGKSEEQLKKFPDNTFSGVITDPPYEMNFMNKKWDSTGITYSIELWKEVLRVSKPGSFLFCFGGTRTHHRIAVSIEDAGWIIKDEMNWIYGQGFPKSTNISKQIDKEAGFVKERGYIPTTGGLHRGTGNTVGCFTGKQLSNNSVSQLAKQWDGYGTGLKPAWEPILVLMKPLEKGLTYAQNAEKWKVAGLNINGGRIGKPAGDRTEYNVNGIKRKTGNVFGKQYGEIQFDGTQSRWPANVILTHSPDCVYIGTKEIGKNETKITTTKNAKSSWKNSSKDINHIIYGKETIEVWACVSDCPIRIMDNQSGVLHSGDLSPGHKRGVGTGNVYTNSPNQKILYKYGGDSGGASRFFYCAKASKIEKEKGLKDFVECIKCGKFNSNYHTETINGKKIKVKCTRNNHPTVKPLDLMKYLCTLLKMPNENQIILDPFCGTGTTLVACKKLGVNYIGIEQDLDSYIIAIARVS